MNTVKERLLKQESFKLMLENVVTTVCAVLLLDDKTTKEIINRIQQKEIEDLAFNTFCSHFDGEDNLSHYVDLIETATAACNNFVFRLQDIIEDILEENENVKNN